MVAKGNVNITKVFVDVAINGGKGQRIYWDEKIRGFGLRVGNRHKASIGANGHIRSFDQHFDIRQNQPLAGPI